MSVEVLQDGIVEDYQLLIVVDSLALAAELGIVGFIVLYDRLDFADGLRPVDLVFAGGTDNRYVCEQIGVLSVEIEQCEDGVQESGIALSAVRSHSLYGRAEDDVAVRMACGIFVDGSVNPCRKPEQHSVKPVLFEDITIRGYFHDILDAVFAERYFKSGIFLVNLPSALKEEDFGQDEDGVIDL